MLNERLRARIEAVALRTMKDRALIEREVHTPDIYGDPTDDAWETVAANVPCRVIRANRSTGSAVQETGGQETLEMEHQIVVPRWAAMDIDQRVTVTSAIDGTTTTYKVVRITAGWTDEVFRSYVVVRRYGES
jgi:hypothetical protein